MEEDGGVSNGAGGGEVFLNGGAAAGVGNGAGGAVVAGGANGKAVQVLQRSFGEVQGILEQNRVLIQEISQNHQAREADGLTRNVALIRELNTNIARVVDLYAGLSCSFSRSVTGTAKNSPSSSAADPSGKGHKRQRSSE